MAKYLHVTGKILSRDRYSEERWNPDKKEYEVNCADTLRVEYTVNDRIYTHNFTGGEIVGKIGENVDVFYREDDPEKVISAAELQKSLRTKKTVFIIVIIFLLVLMALLAVGRVLSVNGKGNVFDYVKVKIFGPSVKNVPDDYISVEEHMQKVGLQDFTDFCIYRYDTDAPFKESSDYLEMTEEDCDNIRGYFTDFKNWMEAKDRLDEYTFDESMITPGDYYFIYTKEGEPIGGGEYGKYDNYSVWFFDTQTQTLYFIHNNI